MRYFVSIDGHDHEVDVRDLPDGTFEVCVDGAPHSTTAEVRELEGASQIRVGQRMFELELSGEPPEVELFCNGRHVPAVVQSALSRAAAGSGRARARTASGDVVSPMPGRVVSILVKPGDRVEAGTPVAVVEAMKMENQLVAPAAGVVERVCASAGDAIESGARLVVIGA
jgi:biotin carboxyl carrier protein